MGVAIVKFVVGVAIGGVIVGVAIGKVVVDMVMSGCGFCKGKAHVLSFEFLFWLGLEMSGLIEARHSLLHQSGLTTCVSGQLDWSMT